MLSLSDRHCFVSFNFILIYSANAISKKYNIWLRHFWLDYNYVHILINVIIKNKNLYSYSHKENMQYIIQAQSTVMVMFREASGVCINRKEVNTESATKKTKKKKSLIKYKQRERGKQRRTHRRAPNAFGFREHA